MIVYCEKCHNAKRQKQGFDKAVEEIELLSNQKVINKCVSYCGPGKSKHFFVHDDQIYEADTYEELMDLLKKIK